MIRSINICNYTSFVLLKLFNLTMRDLGESKWQPSNTKLPLFAAMWRTRRETPVGNLERQRGYKAVRFNRSLSGFTI